MADIAQLLANSAQTNADFDLGKINRSYWQGLDEYAKNDLRGAFRPTPENPNGVPMKDGQLDLPAVMKTLFQKGDIAGGVGLVGASSNAADRSLYANGGQPQQPIVGPSTSRNSVTIDPSKRPDAPTQSPPGNTATGPNSIVGIVGNSLPDELAGPIIQQVSALAKLDPNAPINDPQTMARVTAVTQAAIARAQGRQPQAPQPQVAQTAPQGFQPSPQQLAAQNDPELKRLRYLAASPDKPTAEAARAELKIIRESQMPTNDMKNAQAAGKSLEEYQSLGDERTAQRDILTKSLLPRVDASQEKASAARDDINAIHLAREQLDAGKGIFSGSLADKKLALGKIYAMLGGDNSTVANTEAYGAAIGQRVASIVKAFGSGTAISDGDRKFAAAMAGGNITLDEMSMRRILDIGERAARGKIDIHNQFVDKIVGSNEALKSARDSFLVQSPDKYKIPAASPGTGSVASRADYEKLTSGSTFTGPDGKQWRKP